jgi:hypothetical protein
MPANSKYNVTPNMIVTDPVTTPRLIPVSSITDWSDILEVCVMCDNTNRWIDTTGKRNITVVGTPATYTNQLGFRGSSGSHLNLGFTESDTPVSNGFTAFVLGRADQDGVYSTFSFMGASSGTSPSSYRGWNIRGSRDGSNTRGIFNISVVNGGNAGQNVQLIHTVKTQNDVARFRLNLVRVNVTTNTISVFDLAGYNGVDPLPKTDLVFTGTLTSRLRGNTPILLGSDNGYTGSDQSQTIAAGLFSKALTDAQVKDLAISIKNQFDTVIDINGVDTPAGLSRKVGFTPINLFAPAIV